MCSQRRMLHLFTAAILITWLSTLSYLGVAILHRDVQRSSDNVLFNLIAKDRISLNLAATYEPKHSDGLEKSVLQSSSSSSSGKMAELDIKVALRTESGNRKLSYPSNQRELRIYGERISDVKKRMKEINDEQIIRNENIFGPISNETPIFLVQVHKRLDNLRYLVESMERVRGINETLVIFSHDFWDPAINIFVAGITAFRVMQMFYPFSIQLHPFSFPGQDPRDCGREVDRTEELKCNNKDWPDSYGHYREAHITQIKHHWWWKIQRVFDGLRMSREWSDWILFLEEDHYLAPDILYVFHHLRQEQGRLCPYCRILALGNHRRSVQNSVELGDWIATKHNLGYAMNRSVWESIKECGELFCLYDDYNWDWTINRLVQSCCKPKLAMISVAFSRVVHVGSCGTHIKKANCNVLQAVTEAEASFSKHQHLFFPESFTARRLYNSLPTKSKNNGGWGDLRDRELCLSTANGTVDESTILRLQLFGTS